jgi:RNA polymerase sigma-70 factor (ECF subfamily)
MTDRPPPTASAGGDGPGPAGTADDVFEQERPRLVGLAYRMLGTVPDAEDVVQDVWLRWRRMAPDEVDRPAAWLTTVTTRVALDHLRSVRRRREAYVGPWLPEPLVGEAGPAESAELAESLRMGFLTLLDQLAPTERAVFLLADVFGLPFAEIATTVGKSEVACRQIASRARRRVRRPTTRPDAGASRAVVDALLIALASGDPDRVMEHLAPDVVCVSDGGATRRAARRPVVGAERVARFLVNLTRRHGGAMEVASVLVGGEPGTVISLDGTVDLVTAFEVDGDRVVAIRSVRNPDKLVNVGRTVPLR